MIRFDAPVLTTERLILRLPQASDLPAYFAYRNSDRSTVTRPMTEDQAFQHLAAIIGQWQLRGFGRWMVTDRVTGDPLGVVGLYHPADWPEREIAWTVFEQAEGKGIAFEAALAARRYAYDQAGWTTAISLIADDNLRSQALARRMGAEPEGRHVVPDFGDLQIWRHPAPEALT